MIQEIRDNIMGGKRSMQIIVAVMVIALIGSFSFSGLMSLFKKSQSASCVGCVGDSEITRQELRLKVQEFKKIITYFNQQFGSFAQVIINMQGLSDPGTYAINQLKNEKLLELFTDQQDLVFSGDYSAEKLQDPRYVMGALGDLVPQYLYDQNGNIQRSAFVEHLAHQGLTLSDFDRMFENALKKDLALKLIKNANYEPKSRLICLQDSAPRTFSVAELDFLTYLQKQQAEKVDDKTLHAFYDSENQKNKKYWTTEKRTGFLWTFKAENFERTISENAIQKYYNEHKKEYVLKPERVFLNHIVVADEKVAQEIVAKLQKDPSQFAALARSFSTDKKSSAQGGDFGSITAQSDLSKLSNDDKVRYEKAFALFKDGSVSPIFKTSSGFEILARNKKEYATYKDLTSVRSVIEKDIKTKTFAKVFGQEIRGVLRKDQGSFNAFAQKHKAEKTEIHDQQLAGLVRPGARKLVDNTNVLELVLFEPSRQLPFEQVKTQVAQDYALEKAHVAFDKDVELLTAQFFTNPESIKNHFALNFNTYNVSSSADWDGLKNKKAPIDRMKKIVHINKGFVDKNDARAYFVRLDKVLLPSEKVCGVSGGQGAQGDQFLDSVIASLGRHVTINIRQDVVDQLVKTVS
ncbi:MAG: PpiC-type peptidyl-prolyl cis-trans isomerase [candidate division TM6 bacterium GW2011_GWE2_41_16]|nr:MAG: PpiC-type peptidyl-prolyl cis-trans isomerase [candidate division TM6 bacterium GW2011_GWE2_41_16]